MSNGKKRYLKTLVLALCLLLIMAIGWQMWHSLNNQTVVYGIDIIKPVEKTVCLGGTIHFPVDVRVSEDVTPNQIEIAESWCRVGISGPCYGIQPAVLRDGSKRLPLLREKHIVGVTQRQVPPWVTLGEWEFWHSSVDLERNIEAYIVGPITVKDCP